MARTRLKSPCEIGSKGGGDCLGARNGLSFKAKEKISSFSIISLKVKIFVGGLGKQRIADAFNSGVFSAAMTS